MRIGVFGTGQLARMMALVAPRLGMRCEVFGPDESPCAADVALHVKGDLADDAALENFASRCDVLTYELEHLPVDALRAACTTTSIYPSLDALAVAQDRLLEKELFQELQIPTMRFHALDEKEPKPEIEPSFYPARLKTRHCGYDGKGQHQVTHAGNLERAWAALERAPSILEQQCDFERELSLIAVRDRKGTIACYPLVENQHQEGILRVTTAPAPALSEELQKQAESYARRILERFDYVGVLAVEFFWDGSQLIANELAPRVHNSGHWSMDGAYCCQFEQHLRAITGLPLGSVSTRGVTTMTNLIGVLPDLNELAVQPRSIIHLYGKAARPGRKLGHINQLV